MGRAAIRLGHGGQALRGPQVGPLVELGVLGLTLLAAVLGAAYRMAEWNRPGLPLLSLIPVIAFGAVIGVAGALVLYALVASRQRG